MGFHYTGIPYFVLFFSMLFHFGQAKENVMKGFDISWFNLIKILKKETNQKEILEDQWNPVCQHQGLSIQEVEPLNAFLSQLRQGPLSSSGMLQWIHQGQSDNLCQWYLHLENETIISNN